MSRVYEYLKILRNEVQNKLHLFCFVFTNLMNLYVPLCTYYRNCCVHERNNFDKNQDIRFWDVRKSYYWGKVNNFINQS